MNSAWTEFTQNRSLAPLDVSTLSNTAILAPCGDDAILKVSGSDATEFLHGQLSSDVKNLQVGSSQLSSYSSPKGMVYSHCRLYKLSNDECLLRLPRSLTVSVGKRLKMFVLRAQVEITVDESVGVLLLAGSEASALTPLCDDLPDTPDHFSQSEHSIALKLPDIQRENGSLPYYEVVLSNEHLSTAWKTLTQTHLACDPSTADLLRILSGEPHLSPSTTEQFVAQNLNLHLNGGISFKKGCYPGQEYIAKTQYRGRLRSQLFRLTGETELEPGAALYSNPDSNTEIGTVLKSAWDGQSYQTTAVLRLKATESGTVYTGDNSECAVHTPTYSGQ
ncbi:glycine cleavage T protein [gamma proteobacterium HTCC5015]|nr:glycine cleavage T protein [gamma proteobacterium HTCC5015]